ncbi:MAG TPA: helix-turn-helix domain-containing protein [Thermoanaerobaculales bacterium]|nr:helix-turn-helix domain-containing protein [Thermoanaerobaculales bacterium]
MDDAAPRLRRLLRPADAAELLNVSTRELQRLAREGVIPAIKVGRRWRLSEAALEGWIAKGGAAK